MANEKVSGQGPMRNGSGFPAGIDPRQDLLAFTVDIPPDNPPYHGDRGGESLPTQNEAPPEPDVVFDLGGEG